MTYKILEIRTLQFNKKYLTYSTIFVEQNRGTSEQPNCSNTIDNKTNSAVNYSEQILSHKYQMQTGVNNNNINIVIDRNDRKEITKRTL